MATRVSGTPRVCSMENLLRPLWAFGLLLGLSSSVASAVKYDYPAYQVTLLNQTVSYRQNVCDRHEDFYNGTVSMEKSLRGLQLRPLFVTGAGDLSPVNDPEGKIQRESLEPAIRVMDLLADRAGFTWRKSYAVAGLVSEEDVQEVLGDRQPPTIDEMLEWAVDTFDMVAMNIVKTQDRSSNGNSFLEGYVDSSIIMVGKKLESRSKLSLLTFLEPFDWSVWLVTIATFFIAALGYHFLEWVDDGKTDANALVNQPTENLFYASMAFTGDCKYEPQTNHARLYVLLIAFWGLILSSAYTANLASFLVAKNTPIAPVESVGDAVALGYQICAVAGAAPSTEVLKQYPQANMVLVHPDHQHDIFANVLTGECDLAVTTLYEWDLVKHLGDVNLDCMLRWIGRTYKFAKSGFVTLSDSGVMCSNFVRDVLSVHITEMIDDGTIDAVMDDYFKSRRTNTCGSDGGAPKLVSDDDNLQALSLLDLGGLFVFVYLFWALACGMALLEKRRKKRRMAKKNALRGGNSGSDENKEGLEALPTTEEACTKSPAVGDSTGQNDRDQLESKLESVRLQMEEMQALLQKIPSGGS